MLESIPAVCKFESLYSLWQM